MTQIFLGSMKKIISILGVFSLFAACTAELETKPEIIEEQASIIEKSPDVLYASIEEGAETKVYLDENYKVLWHADDRISVFNKNTYNQQYRFEGNTGDNSGTFSKVDGDMIMNPLDNVYAVYPYSVSTSISNSGVLTVNYPAAQTYSADSFGRGANTMVAVADGDNLQFKNACGYLMFKLYGTGVNVKTISLRGNNNERIAGEATITMPLGDTPTVTIPNYHPLFEIILTCTDAVTIGTSSSDYTEFWFAIPPVTFTKGFTITVTDEEGRIFTKSTSSPLEIVRSYVKKMAPIKVDPIPYYFSLTALEDGTVSLSTHNTSPVIEYSFDCETWDSWDFSAINVASGNTVYFRGKQDVYYDYEECQSTLAYGANNYSTFVLTGRFSASGTVQSLLTSRNRALQLGTPSYAFYRLFKDCVGLITPPNLTAISINYHAYEEMFSGCTNLESAPALPALELETGKRCYKGMFYNCQKLVTPPELPARTLREGCYYEMFQGCTSLEVAPILPATVIAANSYCRMFYGCSKINYVKALFTTNSSVPGENINMGTFEDWLTGTAPSGTLVRSNDEWGQYIEGYVNNNLPDGWTIIRESEE